MSTNELEAHIIKRAQQECCWRFTFENDARMTIYRPRELALAEAKRYGKVVKMERRAADLEWVEVKTEA